MNNQNTAYSDQDIMQDALASEKFLSGNYNTFIPECATPQIRSSFISMLGDTHQMQNDIYMEMSKRGWYQTTPAEAPKIQQAKTKFQKTTG